MSERKLVTIEKVKEIRPIEGADNIECAIVRNWPVVVKKGEYKVGNWCIYYEIDSFLPIHDDYEFLRKGCYKKFTDGTEGFRLKTIKLRGQISQGLLMPITMLNEIYAEPEMVIGISSETGGKVYQLGPYEDALRIEEGVDITELMGVTKYEPPLAPGLQGVARGNFPSFIKKTDEERIQNMGKVLYHNKTDKFYVAEKLDGSSTTYYLKDGVFGVCSRNLDLEETEGNMYWQVARELNIEMKLRAYCFTAERKLNMAIQGELIGEGIQGNPYKIKGRTVKFFNVFDIDRFDYLPMKQFLGIMEEMELDTVPIIEKEYVLPDTVDEILTYAEGKSVLNNETEREGLVFRTIGENRLSFKAISNNFLLKEK